MKPFNIFFIIFFLEMFSEQLATSSNLKKNSVRAKTRKSKKQVNASYYPSYTDSTQIGTSDNRSIYSRQASTYARAGEHSVIVNSHPLLYNLKRARYVEKLKYYEDDPGLNKETEAISVNPYDDTYYRPFSNKPLILQARASSSCEAIQSIFVCSSTPLCVWDNVVNNCFMRSSAYRFKSKNRNFR